MAVIVIIMMVNCHGFRYGGYHEQNHHRHPHHHCKSALEKGITHVLGK